MNWGMFDGRNVCGGTGTGVVLPSRGPAAVVAAIEFMRENAAHLVTVSDIAAHCHVGVRALQALFAKHLGKSPMRYLREVRLEQVHRELLVAEPISTTVTRIAVRWGFTHLSRFAAEYRAVYGQVPSATLRRRRV